MLEGDLLSYVLEVSFSVFAFWSCCPARSCLNMSLTSSCSSADGEPLAGASPLISLTNPDVGVQLLVDGVQGRLEVGCRRSRCRWRGKTRGWRLQGKDCG